MGICLHENVVRTSFLDDVIPCASNLVSDATSSFILYYVDNLQGDVMPGQRKCDSYFQLCFPLYLFVVVVVFRGYYNNKIFRI